MDSMKQRDGISTPLLAADAVILCSGRIVLIRRSNPPFQGCYALPGGFVEVGESVEAAAIREAREETGLVVELLGLVGIYSDPARDPRGHVVSAAFLARPAEDSPQLSAGSDAAGVAAFPPERLPPLAFDHARIIDDALSMLSKMQE